MLNASRVYHSVDIKLLTVKEIFCELTEQTKTTWMILKLEDDPRTLPLASIGIGQFHSIDDSSDLSLPGRFLPYGFYEIRARVEMRGVQDVFETDSMFIDVVQTPWLEPAVIGGFRQAVPRGLLVSVVKIFSEHIFCQI